MLSKTLKAVFFTLFLGIFLVANVNAASVANTKVQNFLFIPSSELYKYKKLIENPKVDGVQVQYTWRSLEPEKEKYNFKEVQKDLAYLNSMHKKMFIQLQDRFFKPNAKYIPQYLQEDPKYEGGLTPQIDNPGEGKAKAMGWATMQWNKNVRMQYQKLIKALAKEFDGKIYGINLPETAIDVNPKEAKGFSCDNYFNATMNNIKATKKAFKKSYVVQYVNFFPCEWDNNHNYMGRLFNLAVNNKVGLGGPDVVPYKKGQMHNSYPFFNKNKGKLAVVIMAVQGATRTYTNPKTGKKFTNQEFIDFATNYLGVNIISWEVSSTKKLPF